MNAIIGFSELMQSRAAGALSVKQGEYIGDFRQSGLHLLSIINDILDLSKIDSETAVISETPVNLHQVASSSMALVADRAHVAGVGLVNAVPTTLPEIAADVRMLKQIMNNLLSNAVKFTHRDGRVTVGAETNPDASVSIWVADTGIGMRPEEISIALSKFGKFSQSRYFFGWCGLSPGGRNHGTVMKKVATLSMAAAVLSACASSSSDLATSYVSPVQYQNYTCTQIGAELTRVNRRAGDLQAAIDKDADNDAIQMGIGLVLFWPACSFLRAATDLRQPNILA